MMKRCIGNRALFNRTSWCLNCVLLILFLSGICAGFGHSLHAETARAAASRLLAEIDRKIEASEKHLYLFSYFSGQTEGLKLCYSEDLYNWKEIPGPHLPPEVGSDKIMRDPFIKQAPDGTFHMVWTTGWGRRDIGYSSTKDLLNWTKQELIPVMGHKEKAINCWAPKLFYDQAKEQWMIFWSTWLDDGSVPPPELPETSKQHRIFYTTTKDFKTFTETRLLFDPGYSCIDAFIYEEGSQYYMFFKDERGNDAVEYRPGWQNIRMAKATSPYGPFGEVSKPITGYGPGIWHNEGPCVLKEGPQYFLFYDHHSDNRYFGAARSTDLKRWTDISNRMSFPKDTRHGSIIKVKAECLNKVLNE